MALALSGMGSLGFASSKPAESPSASAFADAAGSAIGAERVIWWYDPERRGLYRKRSSVMRVVKVNPDLEEEVSRAREERGKNTPNSKSQGINLVANANFNKFGSG